MSERRRGRKALFFFGFFGENTKNMEKVRTGWAMVVRLHWHHWPHIARLLTPAPPHRAT